MSNNSSQFTKNWIKEFRKQLYMTQSDLAVLLGVSTNAVSAWECGYCFPDLPHAFELAMIFGADVEELFPGLIKYAYLRYNADDS